MGIVEKYLLFTLKLQSLINYKHKTLHGEEKTKTHISIDDSKKRTPRKEEIK